MTEGRTIGRRARGVAIRALLALGLLLGGGGALPMPGAAAPPGQPWAWGLDAGGQLGDGTLGNPFIEPAPRPVAGASGATALAAGNLHSLALMSDGGVSAWGDDTYGQLGDGVFGPDAPRPQRVPLLPTMVAVSAGGFHSLALAADGQVWSWGRDTEGQLGDGTVSVPMNTAVVNPVRGLAGVSAIAAGYDHSVALKGDGTVWAWGNDYAGQVGDGTVGFPLLVAVPTRVVGLSGMVAVAAGHNHSIALKNDGTVWAWGRDDFGQLGDGTPGAPNDTGLAARVVGLGDVVAIAAGESHNLALKGDGTIWAWGADSNGQLGDGTTNLGPNTTPKKVGTPPGMTAVAAGRFHSLALGPDGTLWAWGNDEFGQLGDGAIGGPDLRPTPAAVAGLAGVTTMAAGSEHTLALGVGAGGPTVALTVSASGPGSVSPGGGSYSTGSGVTLTATPAPGAIFAGWTVDGAAQGWANPLSLTLASGHVVVALFAAPAFSDVPDGQPYTRAVRELAARDIINGYGDGRFGPDDGVKRAQMAALIARAMGWTGPANNPFSDRCDPLVPGDCVDAELWNAVGLLADPTRDVARGYSDAATCRPAPAPCYDPRAGVTGAQTISFITRAMVARGLWQPAPESGVYPNVPGGSGHRADLATFVANAGALPDAPNTAGPFAAWDAPTTRGWFARALFQALDSYYSVDRVP